MTNSVALLPNGRQQFISATGAPYVGGTVTFYVPSTTTPKNTWQDSAGTILNTNPLTLDSIGSAAIWGNGSYRQILKDHLGNTVWDVVTTAPQINGGQTGASYTLSGQGGTTASDGDGHNTAAMSALGALAAPGVTLIIDVAGCPLNAAVVWNFGNDTSIDVTCPGYLIPTSGIGTALTIENAVGCNIDFQVIGGGGATTDQGLAIQNLHDSQVMAYGNGYNGTVLNVTGTKQDATYNTAMQITLWARNCYRALLHGTSDGGKFGDDFGSYAFVSDENSTIGSLIQNVNDLNIVVYQATASNTNDSLLTFSNIGAGHYGKISLGGSGSGTGYTLLTSTGGTVQYYDELYLLGNNTGPETGTGMVCTSPTLITVGYLNCRYLLNGVTVPNGSSFATLGHDFTGCTHNIVVNGSDVGVPAYGSFAQVPQGRFISEQFANGQKLGWLTTNGHFAYWELQGDNNLVLNGTKSDGSTFAIMAIQLDQASAQAIVTPQAILIESATAMPAGGTADTGLLMSSTANFGMFFGSGAPTLSAAQGSLYLRSDGSSTSTRAYINTNGTTGWTAITTAA